MHWDVRIRGSTDAARRLLQRSIGASAPLVAGCNKRGVQQFSHSASPRAERGRIDVPARQSGTTAVASISTLARSSISAVT